MFTNTNQYHTAQKGPLMSDVHDRLTRLYARASAATLATALEDVAAREGIEYRQARTWLVEELERRSPNADAAADQLVTGDRYPSHATYARTVGHAARTDPHAR